MTGHTVYFKTFNVKIGQDSRDKGGVALTKTASRILFCK